MTFLVYVLAAVGCLMIVALTYTYHEVDTLKTWQEECTNFVEKTANSVEMRLYTDIVELERRIAFLEKQLKRIDETAG